MSSVSLRSKSNLISAMAKRYSSTATATQHKESKRAQLPKEAVRVTKLDNGIVVASLENHSPVTRIAAVVNAGPRDETYAEQGISHALRVYSSLATRNYSVFGVSRNLDQVGADFSITSTREQTIYSLQIARNHTARGVDVMGDVVSRPEFRFWEINDAHPRFDYELNLFDEQPELKIVELIHKASYKNALSNSLYAPRFNTHNLNSEALKNFRNKHFTNDRLTLVGLGISHDDLIRHAGLFRLSSSAAPARQQAKYHASEIRHENESELVHAILAGEGAALNNNKNLLASQIASHAFGQFNSRIKYSNGTSKISKAAIKSAKEPASVASFSANYSDSGLFGFHVVGHKSDIGHLLKGVYQEVAKTAKSGFTNEEIARAKNSLKASLAYNLENQQNQLTVIGQNPNQASSALNAEEAFKNIDAVSANDVNAFVQKLASTKHSLAAIGDLSELPRVEELSA